jgi:murein DD-endopeptidase MepM/ murein hydrolase activator NlpD
MVALDPVSNGIAGIRATLSRSYRGIPAGSSVIVSYAEASASDATPAPSPHHGNTGGHKTKPSPPGGGTKTKPAPSHGLPKRKVPPDVRLLHTKRGFTFPVYGKHQYTDTFGAPRADTGRHEGNDIFAAAGTPVVAVTTGSLNHVGTLPISGNRLWVKSDKGDCFFYAHLSAFASDARDGLHVKAGQVIGFVGSTGDAEKTPPHLHFEVHPGCGKAVDPYPFLRAWEGRRDVPAAAWLVHYARDSGLRPGTLVELRDFLAG